MGCGISVGALPAVSAAKELVDTQPDAAAARAWIVRITGDFAQRWMPDEVRRLGRTLRAWTDQIVAWHDARVSNGPTEAINNRIKRVKRVAFGFRRFDHYRTRALLYAGQPDWALLNTLTPPCEPKRQKRPPLRGGGSSRTQSARTTGWT